MSDKEERLKQELKAEQNRRHHVEKMLRQCDDQRNHFEALSKRLSHEVKSLKQSASPDRSDKVAQLNGLLKEAQQKIDLLQRQRDEAISRAAGKSSKSQRCERCDQLSAESNELRKKLDKSQAQNRRLIEANRNLNESVTYYRRFTGVSN